MTNWRFFVPFAYFVSTRLMTVEKVLSWLVIYPASLTLAYFSFTPEITVTATISILVGMITIYTIYELGYIANDTFTVAKETAPTLRLDDYETLFVKSNWHLIVTVRVSLTITFLILLKILNPDGLPLFCLILAILSFAFYFYNKTRGTINIPLHFILVTCRFSGPCMLLMPDVVFLCFTILAFPIINLLERASEHRYNISWLQGSVISNQNSGRWLYYLITSALWVGISTVLGIGLETTTLLVFLFFYRLISPVVLSKFGRK